MQILNFSLWRVWQENVYADQSTRVQQALEAGIVSHIYILLALWYDIGL